MNKTKQCCRCRKRKKPTSENFHADASRPDGLRGICIVCVLDAKRSPDSKKRKTPIPVSHPVIDKFLRGAA